MGHYCRPARRDRPSPLKLSTAVSAFLLMIVPVASAANVALAGESSVTVSAKAKIHQRFEVRRDIFTEPESRGDQKMPDISLRDCDAEARKKIPDCVLMIYEIQ